MRFIPEIIFALMITVGVSMIVYDVIKGRIAAALRPRNWGDEKREGIFHERGRSLARTMSGVHFEQGLRSKARHIT